MDKKRRDFLKVAGISTLAGLGGSAVIGRLADGSVPAEAKASSGSHGHAGEGHREGAPAKGKRYGMIVDLRKFKENPELGDIVMRACIKAHNIPEFPEKKDTIKWIWMTGYENCFPEKSHLYKDEATEQHQVPVLCNHCDSPPCVRVCPTKATFKNKDGVVIMDFHRCIGCRFCMAACPYGMRSFNWRDPRPFVEEINREFPTRMRGVVEKCNFCAERIGVGKQPACVEACKDSGAMVFGDLNDPDSTVRKMLKEHYTIQRKPALGTHPSVFYIV
ncbi:MAG: 4Fe-4S ferredoxin [Desulfobulbus propionicus]|nr:MAG: 4Fe-4S ferredoxin [Desulfobulbus propionicus]